MAETSTKLQYEALIIAQLLKNAQKDDISLQEWAKLIQSYCELNFESISEDQKTTFYNLLLAAGKKLKSRTLSAIELEQIFIMEKALVSNDIQAMITTLKRISVDFGRDSLGNYQISTPKLFTSNTNAVVNTGYLASYLNSNANRDYTLLMRNFAGQTSGDLVFKEPWTDFAELLFIADQSNNTVKFDLVDSGVINVPALMFRLERMKKMDNWATIYFYINGGCLYVNNTTGGSCSKLMPTLWNNLAWSNLRIFEIWGVKFKEKENK